MMYSAPTHVPSVHTMEKVTTLRPLTPLNGMDLTPSASSYERDAVYSVFALTKAGDSHTTEKYVILSSPDTTLPEVSILFFLASVYVHLNMDAKSGLK